MKIRLLFIAVVVLTLYNSCKKEVSKKINNTALHQENTIKYAKGFDIISTKNEKN